MNTVRPNVHSYQLCSPSNLNTLQHFAFKAMNGQLDVISNQDIWNQSRITMWLLMSFANSIFFVNVDHFGRRFRARPNSAVMMRFCHCWHRMKPLSEQCLSAQSVIWLAYTFICIYKKHWFVHASSHLWNGKLWWIPHMDE